jgi:hypothetical protein
LWAPHPCGPVVEERIRQRSNDAQSFIEIEGARRNFERSSSLCGIPAFPEGSIGHVERGGKGQAAACGFGGQRVSLLVGPDLDGTCESDQVNEILEPSGGFAVAVAFQDRADLVGDVVDQRIGAIAGPVEAGDGDPG